MSESDVYSLEMVEWTSMMMASVGPAQQGRM